MRETWVQSLSWEDPLKKEMVTHSNILAWKIPWTEEPGRLQSMGSQRVRHDWWISLAIIQISHLFPSYAVMGPDAMILAFWMLRVFFNFYFFISWRLITLQHCSGFCHTLKWISHGFTCVPHPDPPSHLPLHPIPLDLPSAPDLSTCLMHPTWDGDLFHPW